MSARPSFFGKFRGVVTDNKDPQNLGRIRATVPDVYGKDDSGWALPASPYAGKNVGLLLLPPEKALVWIEFEHGDPDYPVWTGCFWATGEMPGTPTSPDKKVLTTPTVTMQIDDSSSSAGALTLEVKGGKKVTIDNQGNIEVTNGKATVTFKAKTINLNDGALEVT